MKRFTGARGVFLATLLGFTSPLTRPGFAQQLGCGGITPQEVEYRQDQPTSTVFRISGANTPQLQMVFEHWGPTGTAPSPTNAASSGSGNWVFLLDSSMLGLGVTSVEAWMIDAAGNRTFCDQAFVNVRTPPAVVNVGACGSAAGNWQFNVGNGNTESNFGPLTLTQSGSTLNGSLSTTGASVCPTTTVTWTVTGTYDNTNGQVHVTATNPNPANPPDCVPASTIQMDGTIPLLGCNSASGSASATIPGQGTNTGSFSWTKACDMPTGESSAFDSWNTAAGLATEAGFSATLQPSTIDFAGRLLQESDAGGTVDTCFDALGGASAIGLPVLGGQWPIDNNNVYVGDDYVGYTPAALFYYRLQLYRITGNTGFSCGFTVHQRMTINSCGSSTTFVPYGSSEAGNTNTLTQTITATTVSSQRGTATSPTLTFP